MRKFFLFALLVAATAVMAEDAVLVENFSKVGNVNTGAYTWEGDLCTWDAFQLARRKQDTVPTANQQQAVWFSVSSYGVAKLTSDPLEGGIKAVAFKFARFGSENKTGRVLQLEIAVNETKDSTAAYEKNTMPQGAAAATPGHVDYSHAFNCKANNAVLSITNVSTYTESLTTSGICRIMVADLAITPYLLYTTKEAIFDKRKASSYKNTDLINNTDEGAVVYSISENTIGATIDAASGEVTATGSGVVTVTATWGTLSTSYELTILSKDVATAAFDKEAIRVKVDESVVNNFTTNSTATVAYSSSVPEVATVDPATGAVTLVAAGTTVITATVPENEDYTAAEASYILRVVPENFNLETFDGAHNVTLGGSDTYLSTPTASFNPSTTTGLKWTTFLGSVRDNLGGLGEENIAAVIRSRKPAEVTEEKDNAYLLSSTIAGGIDSIAFDWSCNGTEAAREKPWNIEIYINDVLIGKITDACTAIPSEPYRFTKGNLKVEGEFTIKIVNKNDADANSNHYRWVVDNIEWYSYEAPCEGEYGIMVDGENYIAGKLNTEAAHTEYEIVANLEKDQTFTFYDKCAKAGFLPNGQEEGGYWFIYDGEKNVYSAPAKGKYTIYLKMYGYENNWIWTKYDDVPTGIENAMLKADVRKAVENGVVVIYRNGVRYNLQGQNF